MGVFSLWNAKLTTPNPPGAQKEEKTRNKNYKTNSTQETTHAQKKYNRKREHNVERPVEEEEKKKKKPTERLKLDLLARYIVPISDNAPVKIYLLSHPSFSF